MARTAIEEVAKQIGGRAISRSAGNPTLLTGREISEHIAHAQAEPILVMFDDNGHSRLGPGERAMRAVLNDRRFQVLGVLAVAANAMSDEGIIVHFSIDCHGQKVYDGVDKFGHRLYLPYPMVFGDTLGVLRGQRIPLIIGIGDIGKMNGYDSPVYGSRITRKAVNEILVFHGIFIPPIPSLSEAHAGGDSACTDPTPML